jgi:hypothetical protein
MSAPSYARALRRPDGDGLSPPLKQHRLTAHETGAERVLDHHRRPLLPRSRDLLMETAGDTVRAIDPRGA